MNFEDFNSANEKSQQKLVKNFNEFLNFASINKSRISDKLTINPTTAINEAAKNSDKDKSKTPSPTAAVIHKSATTTMLSPAATAALHPLVQLTRSNFASSLEDSDSSSVPETTWSCSTAATAIQQTNNLSNNSLHLELNSLCSTTPDKTPTFENMEAEGKTAAETTPDDSQDQEYYPMSTAISRELRLESENLDRQVFGDLEEEQRTLPPLGTDIEYEKLDKDSLDLVDDLKEDEIITCPDISELIVRKRERDAKAQNLLARRISNLSISSSKKSDVYSIWETPLQTTIISNSSNNPDVKLITITDDHNSNKNAINSTPTILMTTSLDGLKHNPFIDENLLTQTQLQAVGIPTSNSLPEVIVPIVSTPLIASSNITTSSIEMATNASDEIAFAKSTLQANTTADSTTLMTLPTTLPPPSEFGGGNPFLMFLCLTLLLQHRNTIMKSGMDYNEIAMHFDKMVRKHDVTRVLNQARRMYIDYLKTQAAYNQRGTTHINADVNRNNSNVAAATQQNLQCYSSTTTKS